MPIAILGPTASGKSALAVAVARVLGGTVVNGDPFQAYAGIPIGTGQPDEAERGGVPHLGYGALPLSERTHPADFGRKVRAWIESVERPVLVTGSGLYLRGIWDQLTEFPEVPAGITERVRRWGRELGPERLHRFLAAVDPARAAALHPRDGSRIQRALALHLATGGRPSALLEGLPAGIPEGWRALLVLPGRERQRERVARRVRAMIEAGWIEEVRRLQAAGHGPDLLDLRPLGYAAWMEGGDAATLEARIVRETQGYAKRQGTYFRNQWPGMPTWDPDAEPLEMAFHRLGVEPGNTTSC